MVQYILECIAFQLAFLVIYDFFLKKETFFQWNRVYLIGTYVLSLVLPWVKIEALKTTVSENYYVYPEFFLNTNTSVVVSGSEDTSIIALSWQEVILYGGMLIAAVYFGYKLFQLYKLSKNGSVEKFPNFTRVVITNSELAFSFFRSIFLGDKILNREHASIIKHELVHIEQRHTVDLLFFELMRIVGWFNPLVYVYQNRIAELHEFIADAQVPKKERKAHYDLLLSQIFKTQNISFVNQFFKSSLIKKRIVMLQKSKSKKIFQLKYLLLIPMMFGMLAYTSIETFQTMELLQEQTPEDAALIDKINKEIDKEVGKTGSLEKVFIKWSTRYNKTRFKDGILDKETYFKQEILIARFMTKRLDSLESAKTPFFRRGKFIKKRVPSTARYESYLQHEKTFQILDKNLQYSLGNSFENGGTSIKLLDVNEGFSSELLVYEVANVKDLTGNEVRAFNTRITEIFVTDKSKFKGLVLTDGSYSFEVFDLDLGEIIAEENSTDQKSRVLSFSKVENVPVFPGCEDDDDKRGCFFELMREHIRKNFNYPQEAQEKGIQGRVNTMFVIDETGLITNLKMRGPDSLLINEASRIIGKLPKMKPGTHKGKKVGVAFSIPITFKLNNSVTSHSSLEIVSKDEQLANDSWQLVRAMDSQLDGSKENLQDSLSIIESASLSSEDRQLISNYLRLVSERKRLLESTDENNPIIKSLDEKLNGLKEGFKKSLDYINAIAVVETKEIDDSNQINVPFSVVEEIPIFPGCENEENKRMCFNQMIQKHIAKNFHYPKEAQEKGIQGRVNIMFTIGKDGVVKGLRMRGPDKLLEGEAKRIVDLLPTMIPGKQKGKVVNVPFSIPITFKLGNDFKYAGKKAGKHMYVNNSGTKIFSNEGLPIVIVDGVEASSNIWGEIDASTIESTKIINGADAIAKYGERAKKGVVEITLKKKE